MSINGVLWEAYFTKVEEACELTSPHICAALNFRPIIDRSVALMDDMLDES